MGDFLLLYTPLMVLIFLLALLVRVYVLALLVGRNKTTLRRLLGERRALDYIFKQFGALAVVVAAVVAAQYGFVQFRADEQHKDELQDDKTFS
jgi:hypothetical protein